MNKLISFIFLAVCSCHNPSDNSSSGIRTNIKKETNKINSASELENYLEMIGELDQKFRNQITEVELRFGQNSQEKYDLINEMNKTDEENLIRVEEIFKKFGYPNADSVGIKAASQPAMVIHHSPDLQVREKHIKLLYQAYLNGDITDNLMGLFVDRMYRLKFDERFDMKGPFQMKDRIDSMLVLMDAPI